MDIFILGYAEALLILHWLPISFMALFGLALARGFSLPIPVQVGQRAYWQVLTSQMTGALRFF